MDNNIYVHICISVSSYLPEINNDSEGRAEENVTDIAEDVAVVQQVRPRVNALKVEVADVHVTFVHTCSNTR